MLGAGGCIPGDPDFLAALREATAAAGAVLIFDEVMTSRLAVGGAQELLGITPDMTTLGKYLAGGLSFGAFGGRDELMAAYDPAVGGLTHGGTFNNNAFTMAVGAAVGDRARRRRRAGRRQRARRPPAGRPERPLRVVAAAVRATGWGSILDVHPVAGPVRSPADLADADPRWRELLFHDLLAAGFYLAPRGYLALTMDVTDDDTGRLLDGRRATSSTVGSTLA